MHHFLLHNEVIQPTTELTLSPGQVGFMNGWGIFSTLRVADGILFAFERHYERLRRDAARMHVGFDFQPDELKRRLLSLVEANEAQNATLRVAVVRNNGGLFEAPGLNRVSDLIAFTASLNEWGAGVHLGYRSHARFAASPFAGAKYTSWAENLTMYETAHQAGFDEYILLNEHGQVSECTSANIFAVRGNRVVTPSLARSGCLPGITRALLLEEVPLPGFAICEADLLPADLEASDGLFITSSTRDVLPVLRIEGREIPQAVDRIARLKEAFVDYRRSYVTREREASGTAAA